MQVEPEDLTISLKKNPNLLTVFEYLQIAVNVRRSKWMLEPTWRTTTTMVSHLSSVFQNIEEESHFISLHEGEIILHTVSHEHTNTFVKSKLLSAGAQSTW